MTDGFMAIVTIYFVFFSPQVMLSCKGNEQKANDQNHHLTVEEQLILHQTEMRHLQMKLWLVTDITFVLPGMFRHFNLRVRFYFLSIIIKHYFV